MPMEYYEERVNRYRVLRRTNYDAETAEGRQAIAELKLHGIDPEDSWSLVWSFENLESAENQAAEERKFWKEPRYTVAVKDAGEATVIKRPIY